MIQSMKTTFVVLSAILLTGSLAWTSNNRSPWIAPAQRVRAEAAKMLAKRYSLTLVGIGGGLADQVNELALSFDVPGGLTLEVARKTIVACIEDFRELINSDPEIRPFLSEYPFPASRVRISLFSSDRSNTAPELPYLSAAWNLDDELCYGFDDAESEYKQYRQFMTESYEEARAMVMGEVTNE